MAEHDFIYIARDECEQWAEIFRDRGGTSFRTAWIELCGFATPAGLDVDTTVPLTLDPEEWARVRQRLGSRWMWTRRRLEKFRAGLEDLGLLRWREGAGRLVVSLLSNQRVNPHFDRRRSFAASVRRRVFARNGNRCVACGATERLTVDHIRPVARGGSDDLSNLQTLCSDCNSRKGTKPMSEWMAANA